MAARFEATRDGIVDSILQAAAEGAAQRRLADTLAAPAAIVESSRPSLQAAFCIDVRSEVFRRALEASAPGIRTLGFAGFFGLGTAHRGFASDVVEKRLPVLLNPGLETVSGGDVYTEADLDQRYTGHGPNGHGGDSNSPPSRLSRSSRPTDLSTRSNWFATLSACCRAGRRANPRRSLPASWTSRRASRRPKPCCAQCR